MCKEQCKLAVYFRLVFKDITLATRMANKDLSPMDLSGAASQVAEKWRKWSVPSNTMPKAKA